jgi:hypothetical protein
MAMLNVRLGPDDEKKLQQILNVTQSEKSDLVRKLIQDQWLALQAGRTFLERRGGLPKNLLNGPGDLSSRNVRKANAANDYERKKRARAK